MKTSLSHLRCARPRGLRRTAGYTLAELMLALSIFGFTATATSSLMFATYSTNRAVKGSAAATGQSEVAIRRIVENLRSAVDITYSGSTGLMVQTPQDSNQYIYAFTYYTTYDPRNPGTLQLHELIQREDMSIPSPSWTTVQDLILVDSVASFTAARIGTTYPETWQVSLAIRSTSTFPNTTRTATITGRNLVR